MNLKQWVAQASIAGVLAAGAMGAAPVAGADPDWKNWNDHDWDKWWRVNKWRNDDRPPWGWGPPPAVHWRGHPPEWIDYWGFRVHPIWDPHFKVFGFWLFGIFIPVFVVW